MIGVEAVLPEVAVFLFSAGWCPYAGTKWVRRCLWGWVFRKTIRLRVQPRRQTVFVPDVEARSASAEASTRTPTGFPRSAHPSHGRIGCPLYPETTRCSADRSDPSGRRAPPLPGARSYRPGPHPISRSCLLRGVVKGSLAFTRPAFSPARSSLDGTRTALGTLPGLRTPQTRSLQRTPGRETGIEHSPGATARPTSPHLLSSSSLVDVRPRVARRVTSEPCVPLVAAHGSSKPRGRRGELPRRLEDPAPQPHYVLLMDPPVDGIPVENVVGSVHRHGVQLVLPFARA